MAIVVKHGGPGVGLLSEYGEGTARRAMDSARFIAPKQQMTRGGGRGGSRTTAPKKVAEPFKPANDMKFPGAVPPPLMSQTARPADGVSGIGGVSSMPWDAGNRVDAANRSAQDYNDQAWGAYRARVLAETGRDVGGVPTASSGGAVPSMRQPQVQQPQVSPKQASRVNSMWEAYDEAAASGEYSPEELQEYKRQITEKQMGLEPTPRIKPNEKTAQEQIQEQTWRDPETGALLTIADGKVTKVADAPKAEVDKAAEAQQKADAAAREKESERRRKLMDEARKRVDDAYAAKVKSLDFDAEGEQLPAPPPPTSEDYQKEFSRMVELDESSQYQPGVTMPSTGQRVPFDVRLPGANSTWSEEVKYNQQLAGLQPPRNPAEKLAKVASGMAGQATASTVAPNQNMSASFEELWGE